LIQWYLYHVSNGYPAMPKTTRTRFVRTKYTVWTGNWH